MRFITLLFSIFLLMPANSQADPELIINKSHNDTIRCVKYSPDGKYFATGSKDQTIKLWDIKTGNLIRTFIGHKGGVNSIVFDPTTSWLISADDYGQLIKWDLASGSNILEIIASNAKVKCLALSPNGAHLASGGVDNIVRVFDPTSGDLLAEIKKHKNTIMSLSYSHKGDKLVTAGKKSKETYLWSTIDYSQIGGYFCSGCGEPRSVQFSLDDEEVLITRGGQVGAVLVGSVQTWNGNDKGMWNTYWAPFIDCYGVFSSDKKHLLVGGANGALYYYDRSKIEEKKNMALQYQPPVEKKLEGHTDHIFAIELSPDGKYALTASRDKTFILWDIKTGRIIHKYYSGVGEIQSIVSANNGKHVITSTNRGKLRLWDIRYGKLVQTYYCMNNIYTVAVNPSITLAAVAQPHQRWMGIMDLRNDKMSKKIYAASMPIVEMEFSTDGKYVKVTDEKGVISYVDVGALKKTTNAGNYLGQDSGKDLISQFEHEGGTTCAVFDAELDRYITGGKDGSIKIWKKNKTLCATLIGIGDGDYIAYNPEKFYSSSKMANAAVSFTSGLETFGFDQFDVWYNRPDKVISSIDLLGKDIVDVYYGAYEKRLKKLGLENQEFKISSNIPKLSIDTDNIPLVAESSKLIITGTANSTLGLSELKISVNGVPINGENKILLNGNEASIHHEITLSSGSNLIDIHVVDSKGVKSVGEKFQVYYDKEEVAKLYILSIGVSKYEESKHNLTFADKDAKDISAILAKSGGKFGKIEQKTITNEEATKENILAAKSFLSQATVNDVVVIFIAGHGMLDSSFDYYFGTHDISFMQPEKRGLSFADLESLLYASKSRKKLLLMDTCHSGEVDKDEIAEAETEETETGAVAFRSSGLVTYEDAFGLENTLRLSQELFSDIRGGTGATIISAAGGTEYAMEGLNSSNGLFTNCILDAVTNLDADKDKDEKISVKELFEYVSNKVAYLSNGAQSPMQRAENLLFDFQLF